jgi:hypothetical protein
MRKLFTALLVSAAVALADAPSAIAIKDARIVPVSGPAIPNGTVVLRNGLIESIGANVAIPAGAWIVEGAGLTVYPGLIDALSTWGLPQPASTTGATGRTGAMPAPTPAQAAPAVIRGPEDRPATTSWIVAADQLNPAGRRIETFRSAGFTTAVTFPTTGILAGQGSIVNLAGDKPGQMVVASPAGQYISMRTSGGFGSFPGSLFGVMAYIRQVYLDVDNYKAVKDAYSKNPRGMTRPNYDRALEGVIASPRILLPATRAVEIDRMSKFAAELKCPAVLYGGHEAFKAADRVKLPMLVSLKWPEKARDSDPDDIDVFRTLELRDQAPSTPAALRKAGVKFAFYSDGIERPADLVRAVRRAIEAGLTADDALRALTLSAAEIYGVDDRLGSIDQGKIANLVVTKGDLFQERPQIQMIFIDGKKYDPVPETPTPQTAGGAQ